MKKILIGFFLALISTTLFATENNQGKLIESAHINLFTEREIERAYGGDILERIVDKGYNVGALYDVFEVGVNWADLVGTLYVRYKDGSYGTIDILMDFASLGPSIELEPIANGRFDEEIDLDNVEGKTIDDIINRLYVGIGAHISPIVVGIEGSALANIKGVVITDMSGGFVRIGVGVKAVKVSILRLDDILSVDN